MSDLIEKQAAIDALERTKEKDPKGDIASFYNTITDNKIAVIEALPSVQPEVIRCKDCKNQEKFFHKDGRRKDGGYYIYGCSLAEGYSHVCLDDDYCSRAERRTDE